MMHRCFLALLGTSATLVAGLFAPSGIRLPPPGLWSQSQTLSPHKPNAVVLSKFSSATPYTVANFTQPISHFPGDSKYRPHINGTWEQRYWVDTSSYKPGGPVILLDSGETSGTGRVPFLTQGIVKILANATGGVGIVLEMRYYGTSTVTSNLTTDSMRFLDTKQSLADAERFARNLVIPGLEKQNLTAPGTPWIYYGGSYAGAKAAYAKVTYPDVFYGAIASSGVVEAIVDYWEYFNPIIQNANQTCIKAFESAISAFDAILSANKTADIISLKSSFGVPGLSHNDDFANFLTWPIDWQSRSWDPTQDDSNWVSFCNDLVASKAKPVQGSKELGALAELTTKNVKASCGNSSAEDCLGSHNPKQYQLYDLSQTWRLWYSQFCREEGYYQVGPPKGQPTIVSRFLTIDYQQRICNTAFPPGFYHRLPASPDVSIPNAYGGYKIAMDRLAFIDGEADPWRPATAHSTHAPSRTDSLLRPYYLIPGAVHHWDENSLPGGLSNSSLPKEIRKVQQYEVDFVKSWLKDFKPTKF